MNDKHLRWVHYNRAEAGARPRPPVESQHTRCREEWEASRRGATTAAGKLVRVIMENRTRLSVLQQKLLAILGEEGGSELLDQVGTLRVSGGTMQIEVADPVALYDLRLRWQGRLLKAMQSRLPEAGVCAVRFRLARHGRGEAEEAGQT